MAILPEPQPMPIESIITVAMRIEIKMAVFNLARLILCSLMNLIYHSKSKLASVSAPNLQIGYLLRGVND